MKVRTQITQIIMFTSLVFLQNTSAQTIENENISNTEKIIGLEFTDAERDSMIGFLDEQLTNYKKIRDVELNNSTPPAILFNPIPAGFDFPKERKPLRFSDYSYAKIPIDKNELAFFSIGELAELIRTKQITSVELTEFFIQRLKKYDQERKPFRNRNGERSCQEEYQTPYSYGPKDIRRHYTFRQC